MLILPIVNLACLPIHFLVIIAHCVRMYYWAALYVPATQHVWSVRMVTTSQEAALAVYAVHP